MKKPKITFGIIVLNGEPFTKYCLRQLYPFAYEIIVVEGAHTAASNISTSDGHSLDGTLKALHEFKENEDPENKLQIVTKDGFWPVHDELGRCRTPQSRAYAERATGDYLWQVDIDEFYRIEDMQRVINMLTNDPSITAVSFDTNTYFGAPKYIVNGWRLERGSKEFHRLFKWGTGFQYKTHEPPTVINSEGMDMRNMNWIRGSKLRSNGIYMYHYALLFPWQVTQKTKVYQQEKPEACRKIVEWADQNYFALKHPYHMHHIYRYPAWLMRYSGPTPKQIQKMWLDIESGVINTETRQTHDIERLLDTWWYPLGRVLLQIIEPIDNLWNKAFWNRFKWHWKYTMGFHKRSEFKQN